MKTEFKDIRIKNATLMTIVSPSLKDDTIRILTEALYQLINEKRGKEKT